MIYLGYIIFFRWEKYRFVLVMISFSAFHFCTIMAESISFRPNASHLTVIVPRLPHKHKAPPNGSGFVCPYAVGASHECLLFRSPNHLLSVSLMPLCQRLLCSQCVCLLHSTSLTDVQYTPRAQVVLTLSYQES